MRLVKDTKAKARHTRSALGELFHQERVVAFATAHWLRVQLGLDSVVKDESSILGRVEVEEILQKVIALAER